MVQQIWFATSGIMYQRMTLSQLIVPEKTRPLVMKLAHDSILAGHLGIQRTTTRVFLARTSA